MQKMKKITAALLVVVICLALFPISIFAAKGSASVKYRDYDEVKELPEKYSYSALFWTKDTQVIDNGSRIANGVTKLKHDPTKNDVNLEGVNEEYYVAGSEGDYINIKITNCAVDVDGDLCDVTVEMSNIKQYQEKKNNVTLSENLETWKNYLNVEPESISPDMPLIDMGFDISRGVQVSTGNGEDAYKYIDSNNMKIGLAIDKAQADFTITYYKAGTNKLANIPGVVATLADLDVGGEQNTPYSNELFSGSEGTIPLYDTTFYYNKDEYLREVDNGLASGYDSYKDPATGIEGSTGIQKNTSAMVIQNEKAKFGVTFGGGKVGAVGATGISFFFVPVIPYETPAPIKRVDKSVVYEDEVFHYTIIQHIPNNYEASQLGINDNVTYTKFEITDALDSNIELAETANDKIKIVDMSGVDCSNYFTLKTDNNKIVATAKEDVLDSIDFYSTTYKIIVPVKVKKGSKQVSVHNHATSTYTVLGNSNTLDSNDVETKIQHVVTLDVKVINGDPDSSFDSKIVPSGSDNTFIVTIKPHDGYTLEEVTLEGKKVEIRDLKYKDGVYSFEITDKDIREDIDHVVRAECVKESEGAKKYVVTLDVKVENGEPESSEDSVIALEGDDNEFIVRIKPNDGYSLKEVTLDGKSLNISNLKYEDGAYTLKITDKNIQKNIDHVVRAKCVKDKTEAPDLGPQAGVFSVITVLLIIGIAFYAKTRYNKLK